METSAAAAPAMSSGRLLKSEPRQGRSISEDRIKFIEEEYDVYVTRAVYVLVPFRRNCSLAIATFGEGDRREFSRIVEERRGSAADSK